MVAESNNIHIVFCSADKTTAMCPDDERSVGGRITSRGINIHGKRGVDSLRIEVGAVCDVADDGNIGENLCIIAWGVANRLYRLGNNGVFQNHQVTEK